MPRKNKEKYNEYMKNYMRGQRKIERELLRKAKKEFGWIPLKKRKRKGGKKV